MINRKRDFFEEGVLTILKKKIENPIFHIVFYLAGLTMLFSSNKIEPTNLAGPGLDLWVLLLLFVGMLYLLIVAWIKKEITILSKIIISIIHILGIAIVIWWGNQPK